MRGKSKSACTVKLSKRTYEALRAEADRRGMFMTKLIDLAVEFYVQSREKVA